jgi:hypothetical protein
MAYSGASWKTCPHKFYKLWPANLLHIKCIKTIKIACFTIHNNFFNFNAFWPIGHYQWFVYISFSLTIQLYLCCEISSSHGGEYDVQSFHPWWWRQYAPLKRRSTITLHDSISQKITLNIIFALSEAKLSSYLHHQIIYIVFKITWIGNILLSAVSCVSVFAWILTCVFAVLLVWRTSARCCPVPGHSPLHTCCSIQPTALSASCGRLSYKRCRSLPCFQFLVHTASLPVRANWMAMVLCPLILFSSCHSMLPLVSTLPSRLYQHSCIYPIIPRTICYDVTMLFILTLDCFTMFINMKHFVNVHITAFTHNLIIFPPWFHIRVGNRVAFLISCVINVFSIAYSEATAGLSRMHLVTPLTSQFV